MSDHKIKKAPVKGGSPSKRKAPPMDDITFLLLTINSMNTTPNYAALAAATGMNQKATANRISRLRKKYLPNDPLGMGMGPGNAKPTLPKPTEDKDKPEVEDSSK